MELRQVWKELEEHSKEIEKLSPVVDNAIDEVADI